MINLWCCIMPFIKFSETLRESEFTVKSLDDCKNYWQRKGFRITLANFCMDQPSSTPCMVRLIRTFTFSYFSNVLQTIYKITFIIVQTYFRIYRLLMGGHSLLTELN